MRITVRFKLILLVASALLTLAAVIIQSDLIEAKNHTRLRDIEARLLPRMDIGPRIEAEFVRLGRDFQDAAAAQDPAALSATIEARDHIFQLIASTGSSIEPAKSAQLRWAIQDYYEAAHEVTSLLIQGDTGERQLQLMGEMQRRLRRAELVMKQTVEVDHTEVAAALTASRESGTATATYRRTIGAAGVLALLALGYWVTRQMVGSLATLSSGLSRFSTGDFRLPVRVAANDEFSDVAREANSMAESLKELATARDKDDWVKSSLVEIADKLRGNLPPLLVAEQTLRFLVGRTSAVAGALYLLDGSGSLVLAGSYAQDGGSASSFSDGLIAPTRPIRTSFRVGEGLVGQAFEDGKLVIVEDLPEGYFKLSSGLGEAQPRLLALLPLSRVANKTIGVIELALLGSLDAKTTDLLESLRNTLAVTFEAAAARSALENSLSESQRQAERLAAQEEELRQNNQELATQQEELRRANDELESQRNVLRERNRELDAARQRIMEKAEELGRVSLYKSQFLANMSHELRTPLNSMLLLSHLLAENTDRNLSAKQVEYASTVHSAGEDLLQLINQVLDLSKIEAGKQDIHLSDVPLVDMTEGLARIFRPLAGEKSLDLRIVVDASAPRHIQTDRSRVERIITNLLGNAIKFTERGSVTLKVSLLPEGTAVGRPSLKSARSVAFSVTDTGIGIPERERERIFVPFEQIEATSARRYQGTGLGLSIARESAILLGGELTVDSEHGHGSTFTLILPEKAPATELVSERPDRLTAPADDRNELELREPYILLVEDDPVLAEQLLDIVHARGLKVLIARTGEEGLAMAAKHRPRGIVLDIKLPDVDGWTVLERLRAADETKDIPVHFLSALEAPETGLARGAVGYLTKPATRVELVDLVVRLTAGTEMKDQCILVVEDHPAEGQALIMALEAEHFEATLVPNARDALSLVQERKFSCIVLDLGLPDMDGLALLRELRKREDSAGIGVVVHTGRSLTKQETRELEAYTQAIILKDQNSLSRLMEELRLFVHHVQTRVDGAQNSRPPGPPDRVFDGLRVLVIEDDMRTAYSLLALLQSRGCQVTVAENGKEALAQVARDPAIDCILTDIMMPEMDGYETMRRLRTVPGFGSVPIIALTAKAMPGERERCMTAGASDYLTKPVDGAKLFSTLHRHTAKAENDRDS